MSGREGDLVIRLRRRVQEQPDDRPARLELAKVLLSIGEPQAARTAVAPLEGDDPPIGTEALALLATLDEQEGALPSALERWERLLAYDLDHAEARGHLVRLRARLGQGAGEPTASNVATALPTLDSPHGARVLRYELERELGHGATSTVYLARDRTLGLPLALKLLHPRAQALGPDPTHRFFAEARLIAQLRHPGVVAIYDVDEAARALVMEYLPGGTLRDRLRVHRGRALPPPELLALARSLLVALAYVHRHGVVHGDLTPRNVLLREPGEAVLADFGSAFGPDAQPKEAAGTPLYLSPERLHGEGPSAPSDLWAAGALLWESAAGEPLRTHADLVAGRSGLRPLPSHAAVDARLRDVIRRLIADPAERFETADEAAAALPG